jgi:hypothetical protein
MQNQTPSKPADAEQPADEGLDVTICSAFIVSEETKRINQEVRAENGEAEKRLRAVCQSEQRSRTSAISEYGDPREWDEVRNCAFVNVFSNGKLMKDWTLAEIRERVAKNF